MVKSKRNKFYDSFFHQSFSLPSDSIMYYIAMNPRTAGAYQKMIQTCKYFFVKNPILVIPQFAYRGDDNCEASNEKCPFDLSKIISKLWFSRRLTVRNNEAVNQNILLTLKPKIYKCDARGLYIENQTISCDDLPFLISSAEIIGFNNITVKDENGLNVGIEKIVEVAVKAKLINIRSDRILSNITSETMKEFLKIPHFSKLDRFNLYHIPEAFDLETFYSFIKNNKTTKMHLSFDDSISELYKNRLEKIIDEILATKIFVYMVPCILFAGLDEEKCLKLQQIYFS